MWKTIYEENVPSITARKMGKLNLVIRNELDDRFREEVFKRKGMKKGNLTEALEEALELWINKPLFENLKKIATNPYSTPPHQEKAVETISDVGGYGAKVKLGEIAGHPDSYPSTKKLALERISRLSMHVPRFP